MSLRKNKILIIEDEVAMAEMYKKKLEDSDFKVFVAYTSKEGIKEAEKRKPDLIVLDILLPTETGIAFLRKAKKNLKIRKIPVIVFSNYDDLDTRRDAMELGAQVYFLKTDFISSLIEEPEKSRIRFFG